MNSTKTPFINQEETLQKVLQSSYTERFYMLMKLIRISKMLSNATIIHSDRK
ncbi:MAG: hypothetical protein ABI388_00905 [Bacteroidia bacterium]